jgi:hypothetical protein
MRFSLRKQACSQVPRMFQGESSAPYLSVQDKQSRRAALPRQRERIRRPPESGGTKLLKGTDMKNYCRAGRDEPLWIRRGAA